jgi:glycosyltransferase involved in cell wall biosynthesis
MRFSVAMCTHNGAVYLKEQLESFALQSHPPQELVVCDDGSTDATPQILDDFARRAPFSVRIFKNRDNLGYRKNFEQAIGLCEGDLIALSDQDDFWYPNKLLELTAVFERDQTIGGVFSDGDLMDFQSRPVRGTLWRSFKFDANEQNRFRNRDALAVLLRRNVVTGMTLAFRSALRDRLLPIPATWEHDAWIAILVVLYSRLESYPKRLVRYRLHRHQKIGVPLSPSKKIQLVAARGPFFFLSQARLRNEDNYKRYAMRFDDLVEYLSEDGRMAESAAAAQVLDRARFSHSALAALSSPRLARGREIVRQITGYRRYSIGALRAMLRDFVI